MVTLLLRRVAIIVGGGHLLIQKITPTEEELLARYNPELRQRSLEGREKRLAEWEYFSKKMIEQSKLNKPSEFVL